MVIKHTSNYIATAVNCELVHFTAAAVQEFCPHGTKEECKKVNSRNNCDKLHFKKILHKHTDGNIKTKGMTWLEKQSRLFSSLVIIQNLYIPSFSSTQVEVPAKQIWQII